MRKLKGHLSLDLETSTQAELKAALRFDTAEEAHQAYLKSKRELHEGCTI